MSNTRSVANHHLVSLAGYPNFGTWLSSYLVLVEPRTEPSREHTMKYIKSTKYVIRTDTFEGVRGILASRLFVYVITLTISGAFIVTDPWAVTALGARKTEIVKLNSEKRQ